MGNSPLQNGSPKGRPATLHVEGKPDRKVIVTRPLAGVRDGEAHYLVHGIKGPVPKSSLTFTEAEPAVIDEPKQTTETTTKVSTWERFRDRIQTTPVGTRFGILIVAVILIIVVLFGFLNGLSHFNNVAWLTLGVILLLACLFVAAHRVLLGVLAAIAFIIALAVWPHAKPVPPVVNNSTVPAPASCEHKVTFDPNQNENIQNGGLRGNTPDEKLQNFKADGASNPYVTQEAAHTVLGYSLDDVSIDKLVQQSCYTTFGWDTYNQVVGALAPSNVVSVTDATAPAQGSNAILPTTGENSTEQVGTIGGNRSGIKVTLASGMTFYVMNRCGNIVTPTPPGGGSGGPSPTPTPTPHTCTTCKSFVPSGGPAEQTQPSQNKPTAGYTPGEAEAVIGAQPVTTQQVTTPLGANTGSTSPTSAPHDTTQVPAGNTQPTSAGTSNPQNTQATGQTAPAGDPGSF